MLCISFLQDYLQKEDSFWGYHSLGFDGALMGLWVGFICCFSTKCIVVWTTKKVIFIFFGSDWGYHSHTVSILQPYFSHTSAILQPYFSYTSAILQLYFSPTWLLVNWFIYYLVHRLLYCSQQRIGDVDIVPLFFILFYLTTFGGTTAIQYPYFSHTSAILQLYLIIG